MNEEESGVSRLLRAYVYHIYGELFLECHWPQWGKTMAHRGARAVDFRVKYYNRRYSYFKRYMEYNIGVGEELRPFSQRRTTYIDYFYEKMKRCLCECAVGLR